MRTMVWLITPFPTTMYLRLLVMLATLTLSVMYVVWLGLQTFLM